MRYDVLRAHLGQHYSRRGMLGLTASVAAAAATVASAGLGATPAAAADNGGDAGDGFSDRMFSLDEVAGWAEQTARRYGRDDQRGTWNEVTPETTRQALRLLDRGGPVRTYNLGELLQDNFPAYRITPPRVLRQRLVVYGYQPEGDFVSVDSYDPATHPESGILGSTIPFGSSSSFFSSLRSSTRVPPAVTHRQPRWLFLRRVAVNDQAATAVESRGVASDA